MPESFRQNLPDLACYRCELVRASHLDALPRVPTAPGGLLSRLPEAPLNRTGWPWTVESPYRFKPYKASSISIVVPSFQQGEFLEETLRSVLLQNYPELELIVIDGGSSDGSVEIIERYRPWLSFVRAAADRGQSHAINLGFSLASGEWRGWLNSDDFYLPGAFHSVAAAAQSRANFIYGDSLDLDQSSFQLRHVIAGFAHRRYAAYPGLLPSHGTFWHRSIHEPVWEEQHCAMDYELWIRLLKRARSRHVRRPLGVLRLHSATKSANAAHQQRWRDDAKRNALAHPHLYVSRPWRDREFRVVQRLVRAWRGHGQARRLAALQRECEWSSPIQPAS